MESASSPCSIALIQAPPENRILRVGDEVVVGNLEDAVVRELRYDNRMVLIEYTRVDHNYGRPIRTPGMCGAWPWTSVFKKLSTYDDIVCDSVVDWPSPTTRLISSLLHFRTYTRVNFDAHYQRGYVWNIDDNVRLIDSIFNGRPIGALCLVERSHGADVLDGKQRLQAIFDFADSRFPYKGAYFHTLHPRLRNRFEETKLSIVVVDGHTTSEQQLIQMFIMLNDTGVPHTPDHLSHLRALIE